MPAVISVKNLSDRCSAWFWYGDEGESSATMDKSAAVVDFPEFCRAVPDWTGDAGSTASSCSDARCGFVEGGSSGELSLSFLDGEGYPSHLNPESTQLRHCEHDLNQRSRGAHTVGI